MLLSLQKAFEVVNEITKTSDKLLKNTEKLEKDNIDEVQFAENDTSEDTSKKIMSFKSALSNMKNIKYDIKESIERISDNTRNLTSNIGSEIFETSPLEFLEIYVPGFEQMLKYTSEKLIPTVKSIVSKTTKYSWVLLLKPIVMFLKKRFLGSFTFGVDKVKSILNISKPDNKKEKQIVESIYSSIQNLSSIMGMLSSATDEGNENKFVSLLKKPIVAATIASVSGKAYTTLTNQLDDNKKVNLKNKKYGILSSLSLLSLPNFFTKTFATRNKENYNLTNKFKTETEKIKENVNFGNQTVNTLNSCKIHNISTYQKFKTETNTEQNKKNNISTTTKMLQFFKSFKRNVNLQKYNFVDKFKTFAKKFKQNLIFEKPKELIKKTEEENKNIQKKNFFMNLLKKLNLKNKIGNAVTNVRNFSVLKKLKDTIKSIKPIKLISDFISRNVVSKPQKQLDNEKDEKNSSYSLLSLLTAPLLFIPKKIMNIIKYLLTKLRIVLRKMIRKILVNMKRFVLLVYKKFIRKPVRLMLAVIKKRIVRPIKLFARRFKKWLLRTTNKILGKVLLIANKVMEKSFISTIKLTVTNLVKKSVKTILKPIVSFFVKSTSAFANFIPIPGLGTLMSLGLFALDLKYDITGKIIDSLFDMPQTIKNVISSLGKIFNKTIEMLQEVVDIMISPLIDAFEIIKMISSSLVGGAYSITVKPLLEVIGKAANFVGIDNVSNTVKDINKMIIDKISYTPTFSNSMNFKQKVKYFPDIIIKPIQALTDMISKVINLKENKQIEFNETNITENFDNQTITNTSAPTSKFNAPVNGLTNTSNINYSNTYSKIENINNTTNTIKINNQNINNVTDITTEETENKTAPNAKIPRNVPKPVFLKPVQDNSSIKKVIGYKLIFDQYF